MIRTIMWFTIYALTLGYISIDVLYRDGLRVRFHGWGGPTQ